MFSIRLEAAGSLGQFSPDWPPSLISLERVAHSHYPDRYFLHRHLDSRLPLLVSGNLSPVGAPVAALPAAAFDASTRLTRRFADLAIVGQLLFYELVPKG